LEEVSFFVATLYNIACSGRHNTGIDFLAS
jgi:hypothetical protein